MVKIGKRTAVVLGCSLLLIGVAGTLFLTRETTAPDVDPSPEPDLSIPWPPCESPYGPANSLSRSINEARLKQIAAMAGRPLGGADLDMLVDSLYAVVLPPPFRLESQPGGYAHLKAMERLLSADKQAFPVLMHALRNDRGSVRERAFRILAVQGHLPAFDEAIQTFDEKDGGLYHLVDYYISDVPYGSMTPVALKRWYVGNRHRLYSALSGSWGSRLLLE